MLLENSSIRSICTHVRCCSRREGGKGSNPCPIQVVNHLRLGDCGIRVEEGFGFTSGEYGEYKGSWQMQERNIHETATLKYPFPPALHRLPMAHGQVFATCYEEH
jgi:hypothetical protein